MTLNLWRPVINFASAWAPHRLQITLQTFCPPPLTSNATSLKMARTEIKFKALTFVLTLLLNDGDRSPGYLLNINCILKLWSLGMIHRWEPNGPTKHFAQGKSRHLKALLSLIRFALQYALPSCFSLKTPNESDQRKKNRRKRRIK